MPTLYAYHALDEEVMALLPAPEEAQVPLL